MKQPGARQDLQLTRLRSGQVLPMILIAMAVMAILGIAVLFTGSSDYAQSALVVYGLKAEQFALAGLEEAQAGLYDQLNRPAPSLPQMRKDLFSQIRNRVSSGKTDPIPEIDLVDAKLVERTEALVSAGGGKLHSASAKFYGFRRLKYQIVKGSEDDLFASDLIYYRDPTQKFKKTYSYTPEDYVGWYSITVEASYGKIKRKITATHDIKVVDVSPPARQFALFCYGSTRSDVPNGPPATFADEDLNKGGGLKVFADGDSRVLVRGPFLIEAEGRSDGAGGERPPTCSSYPPEAGGSQRQAWKGWAAIPAIRDGVLDRAGFSFASVGVGPRRPDSISGGRPITQRLVGALTGSTLASLLSDDAGWYILDKTDPQWYAGSRPVDSRNRSFSLVGDPQDPASGGFSPFVGHLWKYGTSRDILGTSASMMGPGKRSWIDMGDDETFYSIEAEGGLVGVYNRIKFTRGAEYFGAWDVYKVGVQDKVRTNYGYRWEKAYERAWLDKTFSSLFSFTTIFLLGPIGGLATIAAIDALGVAPFSGNTPPMNLALVRPADIKNVLPPKYRPYERAATRKYKRLGDLKSIQAKKPLMLDGVIWVDDPSTSQGFNYLGRGIIVSDGAGVTSNPKLTLPVTPKVATGASPAAAKDFLTFVYSKDEDGKTHLAEYQLELDFAPEAGSNSGSVFQGSMMATQGVRPRPGKKVSVAGNLICSFMNKQTIPDDARLSVRYLKSSLGGLDASVNSSFSDGSWNVMALSPRIAGWFDR